MLNIFELSRVREIAESWLICASSYSRIAQSYFLTKKKFSLEPFQSLYIVAKFHLNCLIYIALANKLLK